MILNLLRLAARVLVIPLGLDCAVLLLALAVVTAPWLFLIPTHL